MAACAEIRHAITLQLFSKTGQRQGFGRLQNSFLLVWVIFFYGTWGRIYFAFARGLAATKRDPLRGLSIIRGMRTVGQKPCSSGGHTSQSPSCGARGVLAGLRCTCRSCTSMRPCASHCMAWG